MYIIYYQIASHAGEKDSICTRELVSKSAIAENINKEQHVQHENTLKTQITENMNPRVKKTTRK